MRVVKLGGSLLDWPELMPRLKRWYAAQPPRPTTFVAGGGRLADAVREQQRVHNFSDEAAHWLCIGAMQLNGRMLAGLWPEMRLLDPQQWLTNEAPRKQPGWLPETWAVTSDSIAARYAESQAAAELVLLKSTLPPPGATRATAATAGYVDEFFPTAAAELPLVTCVDLRANPPTKAVLAPGERRV